MAIVYVNRNDKPHALNFCGSPEAKLMALGWETLPEHLRARAGDAVLIERVDSGSICVQEVEYDIGLFSKTMRVSAENNYLQEEDIDSLKMRIEDHLLLHPDPFIVAERSLYPLIHQVKQKITALE